MTGKKKILVVDDDREVINTIAQTLQEKGYEVIPATGFQEGIDKAQQAMPELIYLSLLLQGSNGLKASKAIHSIEGLEKTPVIMMISYEGELDPRYTVTIGIVDVIVKPPDPGILSAQAEKILGGAGVSSLEEETLSETEFEEAEALPIDEDTESYHEEAAVQAEAVKDDILSFEEEMPIEAEATMPGFSEHDEMTAGGLLKPDTEQSQDDVLELDEGQDYPGITEFAADAAESSVQFEAPADLKQTDEHEIADEDFGAHDTEEPLPDDSSMDEFSIDEETDFSEPPFEKDLESEAEEPISIDEETESAKDTIDHFTADDDTGPLDIDQFDFEDSAEDADRKRLPLLIGAALIVIVGLAGGAFLTKKIFFGDSEVQPTAPVEEARTAEEGVQDETIKDVLSLDEKPVQKITPETVPDADAGKKKIEPPATVSKPAVTPPVQKPRKKSIAKKGRYSVQVGAFGVEKNASALVSKLKNKGYDAFMEKHISADKKTIHRVFAGTFNDNKKALELSRTILEKEGIKSFVLHN
ncbi:MAG: SPOR domain-containing protein [Nitrospiraceae bacterium]|nr:MAG: SPOR domain-containing protein [Nitrospiraceae bacterium]